ncbi:MAG: hypothetical protein R2716_13905 [Microthrixaceae bacterium]
MTALAGVFAILAMVAAACTPTPGGGGGTSPAAEFCEFWQKVEEAPPAPDQAVLVKDDVVAMADQATVTGNDCEDPSAEVDLDGAVLAEGDEVLSELGTEDPEPIAAVTGEEIGAGEPVLDNLSVKTLSAEIGRNGITVRGNVSVTLSGTTSTIGFTGTLSNLDNWSVSLSSSGFSIPGVTTSPVVFSGTLRVTNGVPSLQLSASATLVEVGDITVNGASISLTASPATGVKAAIGGTLKIGPSTAGGTVEVEFDQAGALVSANADISAHLVGYQTGGKKIDLQGTVKMRGNADETVVSFSGSGIVGDLVVNAASGELTLATNKATLVGVLDVASGPNYLRYNGTIVWDGITAYTPFLQLEAGGEYSGTLTDGLTVSASGDLETTIIGGQLRTVLTGDFKVGTIAANGTAIVEVNGASTVLYVDAALVGAGFDATLEGAIVLNGGIAEQVDLAATVNGTVDLGDVELDGATLNVESSYGSPLDIYFAGGLRVGSNADLNGSVQASFGPNGSLLSLDGQMNGSLQLDFGDRELQRQRRRQPRTGDPDGIGWHHHDQLPARDQLQRLVHVLSAGADLVAQRHRTLQDRTDRRRLGPGQAEPHRGHEGDQGRLLLLDHRDPHLLRGQLLHAPRRRVQQGGHHRWQLPGQADPGLALPGAIGCPVNI